MKKEWAMCRMSHRGSVHWELVRVMTRAEGWVMVRRHGAMPFLVHEKWLKPVGEDA